MFGNQKGGVGKSQCTVLTAAALSAAPFSLSVLVNDADSQKSIVAARKLDARLSHEGNVFKLEHEPVRTFVQKLKGLDSQNDVIFIDIAGKLDIDLKPEDQEVARVLLYVDYLFIPFVAGNYNLEASLNYLHIVRKIQDVRKTGARKLHVIGFINMHDPRTNASKYLLEDLEKIKNATGLQLMKTPLHRYTLFNDADTYNSIYKPAAYDTAEINFLQWLNEFASITKIGRNG